MTAAPGQHKGIGFILGGRIAILHGLGEVLDQVVGIRRQPGRVEYDHQVVFGVAQATCLVEHHREQNIPGIFRVPAEIRLLGNDLGRPPEAQRALGLGDLSGNDQMIQGPHQFEQRTAARSIVVSAWLLVIQVCRNHKILSAALTRDLAHHHTERARVAARSLGVQAYDDRSPPH